MSPPRLRGPAVGVVMPSQIYSATGLSNQSIPIPPFSVLGLWRFIISATLTPYDSSKLSSEKFSHLFRFFPKFGKELLFVTQSN